VEPALSGADVQQAALVDPGDGAAARADRGDLDHRRAHDHAEVDGGLRGEHDWPPAIRETSKLVPPMSPVMTLSNPAVCAM
jgi:hypothetical protein